MSDRAAPAKACVIGWPVGHSRSPLIHGYWLAQHGIAGSYDKVPVERSDLAGFVGAMRAEGYRGANVTVPHKEAMAALCDRLLPAAATTRSVNTIWFEGEALCGDSTDGQGFLAALDEEASGWSDRPHALVLGAGGAARAIVAALASRGVGRIAIAGRTPARAAALAEELGGEVVGLEEVPARLAEVGLLVNTTPAGMPGQPPLPLDLAALHDDAVVDDIVYVPRETALLRAAAARGLRTVGGLGMLLHQAAPGFARWFGVMPRVTPALRALVEADIEGMS